MAAIAGVIAVTFLVASWRPWSSGSGATPVTGEGGESVAAKVVRSASCGCCGNYVSYLKKRGFVVETEFLEDATERHRQYGVPEELGSCHTTVIDGYVVEGHVPVEAIAKLLKERPAIKGIALPDMPSGSPGMPGPKFGEFEIKSFVQDGAIDDFLRL